MMASYIRRPIPYAAKRWPDAARFTYWMDTFGLDSEYDYDPVWAKCEELGIAPTFHSVGYGWGSRTSISNYVHNHIGNFAAGAEGLLDRDQLREFLFTNAVEFWTANNRNFFAGTAVEDDARRCLNEK